MRTRLVCALVATTLAAPLLPAAAARAATMAESSARSACPVLALSAMPLEADPILAASSIEPTPAYVENGRGFWTGTIAGNPAVVALTGIGMVNAKAQAAAAFEHFGCFSLIVFSGTSGGDYIGDVMVPSRWTPDGKRFFSTSTAALAVMRTALEHPIPLQRTTPTGDPLCTCSVTGTSGAGTPVTVEHQPQIEVGGTGLSDDGFGGRTFPCVPTASDVFGCWPCRYPDPAAATQTGDLSGTVPPFLEPSFVLGYESASAPPPGAYVSEDNETAAVAAVAAAHHTPFIGFRAASDGGGDPLMLPGFPAEFFVYRQMAADNAAATTLAFLASWHAARG